MLSPDTLPDATIEPLTRCNRDGVVYGREAEVEQQIGAALSARPDELLARARIDDKADSLFLQEETLAYLIRRAHRAADDELADGLAQIIVERCEPVLKGQLRSLRADRLEEAVAETLADLFEQLVEPAGSDRGDFLQVRFWLALKTMKTAAFSKAVKEERQRALLVSIEPTGDSDESDERGIDVADPRATAPDTSLLIEEALALLDPNVRTAFLLRVEGWPVEDRDPSVPTISRYFGKTSRTIRYWLTQAEEVLAEWRAREAGE